jgi:hypothetical protein
LKGLSFFVKPSVLGEETVGPSRIRRDPPILDSEILEPTRAEGLADFEKPLGNLTQAIRPVKRMVILGSIIHHHASEVAKIHRRSPLLMHTI